MTTLVLPGAGRGRLRPVDAAGVHVTGGFWAERLATNRERTIPHGLEQLEASGALGNFRHAARGSGRYVGGLDDAGITFPFLDTDVYKWLEAVGWELGRAHDSELAARANEVIGGVESAQRPDGYLGTFVQLSGREPYTDLQWGHELYNVGHLTQAAVAWQRSLGDGRLLAVAERAIGHIERALGEDGRAAIDGHPEIEMALVELFRTTGEERHLRLAALLVERRGHGLLGVGRMGSRYWQDHAPVREAPTMTGHAVRQLYLDSGVVDVAIETDDAELLGAVIRRWEDMWASRTYLTGALGSRHRDEAFGDAFELPSDRAYAETCAAIASVMLSWRLLLATGEAHFADALERTLYNAVLPGVGLDGTTFFYTNPLHLRERPELSVVATGSRRPWYPCACCPPNLMRTLSSFEHLLAATDADGLRIAQLATATIEATTGGDPVALSVMTDYPTGGRVEIEVARTPDRPWALQLRVPAWADAASVRVEGEAAASPAGPGWQRIERRWSAGDRVVLDLPLTPRLTVGDERIDAVRDCAAIERGPLVYCIEQVDLPSGMAIETVAVAADPGALEVVAAPAGVGGLPGVRMPARVGAAAAGMPGTWPYRDTSDPGHGASSQSTTLIAVPYLAWANRTPGAMRVWLPLDRGEPAPAVAHAGDS
jgi:uncharacterized protein